MTSWERGKENEERGERELSDNNPNDNMKGVSDKVGGEIEQGMDNVGDTLSGKQRDLQGKDRNIGAEAGEWVEHRGKDMKDSTT
jgi:hypothetical protein